MDDLRERFAALDRLPVPDVWSDVERRLEESALRATAGDLVPVRPGWRRVGAASPAGTPGAFGSRRGVAFIALAALFAAVVIGGAIAVGSGLIRLTSILPPSPSIVPPTPSVVTTRSPDASPRSASWSVVSRTGSGQWGGTATLLPDGEVLAVGGGGSGALTSAELYDPVAGRWTETGSMHAPRGGGQTATLLPDGQVLVAGGDQLGLGHPPQSSVELYDPASGTWKETGSMVLARSHHSATLLSDGRVLVAGGIVVFNNGYHASKNAELYDPASGTWTATRSMRLGRAAPTAALLPDGRVLVVGGSDSAKPDLQLAELYDPRY